jgi:NAD(P)H dehydrogenase (quinone)
MILVTGATGHVGYHLVEDLTDAGADTTALVRIDAKAADLPTGAGYLVGSLDDPPPAETLRQFDQIFLLSPAREEQVELEVAFLDAVVAAGHGPHVVKVAADGFQDPDCDVRYMRNHRQIAVHLEATGLPSTYIAANMFMENLLADADVLRVTGELRAPAGDGRVAFVASSDVAAVAAHVLTADGHSGRTYVVTGPEALGWADVAARMSAVFARHVEYADIPAAQARADLVASGRDPWDVDGTMELYGWIRGGGSDTVTDEVTKATGDDARPLEDWLSELRGAFVGRPQDAPPPSL